MKLEWPISILLVVLAGLTMWSSNSKNSYFMILAPIAIIVLMLIISVLFYELARQNFVVKKDDFVFEFLELVLSSFTFGMLIWYLVWVFF